MGIGFILTIVGITAASKDWEYAYTLPYAHPMVALSSMFKNKRGPAQDIAIDIFTKDVFVAVAVSVVVFIAGYFIVQRKSVK
jgi:hypothetical protein